MNILKETIRQAYPTLIPPRQHTDISINDGWCTIVTATCALIHNQNLGLPPEEHTQIAQIKEKFGTLRFYLSNASPEALALATQAEDLCKHLCEMCGKPGTLRTSRSWHLTLCNPCNDGAES